MNNHKIKVYYTDKVGSNLWLDSVTGLEYYKSFPEDPEWGSWKYIWESREAGDVLVKTIGRSPEVEFIKRK